jgi:multidrug efflux pump subunit AcrA (membrane-fusion protein)
MLQVTADIPAEIAEADGRLPAGDSVPVTVTWTEVLSPDATTVPAAAVLRLDTGAYAVEVVDESGTTELVVVEPGQRFGTSVEILSGLESGATVMTP